MGILGSILKQLVFGLGGIPEDILEAYKDRRNAIGGQGPQISDILQMMQTTSSRKGPFICIDALDECAIERRAKLLDSLGQLLQQSPGTRIFMTGRPHILPEIGRALNGRVTSVSISSKRDDIVMYLYSRLAADVTSDAMDTALEADILKKIPGDISEMYAEAIFQSYPKLSTDRSMPRFLLVSLSIDAILQETTIHRRRQQLGTMTNGLGLGSAYGETLDRIKRQGGARARLGMAALMWISHSERPLKIVELCHALAVEIGSPDLNTDDVPSIGTLLSCCQGLVIVDKEASTVRLIHFTLQEYLRAHAKNFGAVHSTMAETCLSYLNSQQVKAISTNPSPDPQGTLFLEYSLVYWGMHARRDVSDCAKLLALKLFDDYSNHISTRTLLKAQIYPYGINFDESYLFSGLHCASLFGIVEILTGLIQVEGCDINQIDCVGNTPLVWAAVNGHERVVEILLRRGDVGPDIPGRTGQTPLQCAAWNGHVGVVKMLLERDEVCPDKTDMYSVTPLLLAGSYGHAEVVQMLLKRGDVNPDRPHNDGRTPLQCAAENGHAEVVKFLLERNEVNSNKPDKNGQTPLWCATYNGHVEIVKILLERDEVNPDKPDNDGRTPLLAAVFNGHVNVVKLLLERDEVGPDKPDNDGGTPLWCAAFNGHVEVVKLLLERDEVNPNEPHNGGRTPLWCAAWNGHLEVVKLFLGRGEVDLDKSDNDGQTPLHSAFENGHEGVAKILLERDEVNFDKPDNSGQTPLLYAARNGHTGVVKLLLQKNDVVLDKLDDGGRTPLSWAAGGGHSGIVEMLLGARDVTPDSKGRGGRTPLAWATECEHKLSES